MDWRFIAQPQYRLGFSVFFTLAFIINNFGLWFVIFSRGKEEVKAVTRQAKYLLLTVWEACFLQINVALIIE